MLKNSFYFNFILIFYFLYSMFMVSQFFFSVLRELLTEKIMFC